MAAAGCGHVAVLRLLRERGAAVDAASGHGWTACHFACHAGWTDCVEALVRAGCDVGAETTRGETARQMAEVEGHAAVVERLRALAAELARADRVGQPLAAEPAAPHDHAGGPREGGRDLVQALLAAAGDGDAAGMALLLAAGADPNGTARAQDSTGELFGTTALITAAGHGKVEAAQLLLEAGADPSRAASTGSSPLMVAAQGEGHLAMLLLLLGHGWGSVALSLCTPTQPLQIRLHCFV
jgi:ankyrin repeat protein